MKTRAIGKRRMNGPHVTIARMIRVLYDRHREIAIGRALNGNSPAVESDGIRLNWTNALNAPARLLLVKEPAWT